MALRAVVPYAAIGAAIALASSAAVVGSIAPVAAPSPVPTAAPSLSPRPAPKLSSAARLAYWRDGKLWVSDLDGSLRQPIASTDDARRISLTRWSADGGALAFVDGAVSLTVVALDGRSEAADLPLDLRNAGYRIADLRWSPDSGRVAATLLRPGDGRADAFVVDLGAGTPAWRRVTTLDDLFVGDWVSPTELLAYTAGGALGIVDAKGSNAMRLLSGVQGISPVLGPRGRVYYLVGGVPRLRDPSLPYVTVTRAAVWSVSIDGSDARRESRWTADDVRLDGVLPDGRYLVHVGLGRSAQAVAGDAVDVISADAGVVQRIRVGPDGRIAYGFADDRIVRVDLSKVGTAAASVSVFLDGVADGDVWSPRAATSVTRAVPVGGGPDVTLVFALDGDLWRLRDGTTTLFHVSASGPTSRRIPTGAPRWSPGADRLLLVEPAGPLLAPTTLVATLLDRDGRTTAVGGTLGAGRSFAWSADGSAFAVVVDRRGQSGVATDAQLEVRFFRRDGAQSAAPIDGTEVAWTPKGLLVLRGAGGGMEVARLDAPTSRAVTLVTGDALASDPRATDPGARPAGSVGVSALAASAAGTYGSVRLQKIEATSARAYLVIFDAAGRLVHYLRADALTDLAWSPTDDLFGYTVDAGLPSERTSISTPDGVVRSVRYGRFAGWSLDGKWAFVARGDGLYAVALAGGDPVRVGPAGAPVVAIPR